MTATGRRLGQASLYLGILAAWEILPRAGVIPRLFVPPLSEALTTLVADRVVVLSARPGRVVDDVLVDLPRPRSFAMAASERFGALKDRIWQHIKSAERA